ncbi:MAG: nuclease-related domain-containing protein [Chloroflexota bacterium]
MKAITNTDIIANRSVWARRVAPFTMIFLIGGLVTNFMSFNRPEYFQYTLILLALGFIFATISSTLVNRWVREPRADQILSTTLKKFGNDHILFNYTTAIPHILLTRTRLYVIVTKHHGGQIAVKGRRVTRKFSWRRVFRFFAEEGIGAPINEAQSRVNRLEKLLSQTLSSDEIPEIKPIVIFTDKTMDLTVTDPEIPVMQSNGLKSYLRENDKQKLVSAELRQKITQILDGGYSPQNVSHKKV